MHRGAPGEGYGAIWVHEVRAEAAAADPGAPLATLLDAAVRPRQAHTAAPLRAMLAAPMRATLHAQLDAAYPDDFEEIVERVLLTYRPILSHFLLAHLRNDAYRTLLSHQNLKPWEADGPPPPVRPIGSLTVAQVVLLGGTRPRRVVHSLAADINSMLDGGDRETVHRAEGMLEHANEALESLVGHHVVTPVKGPAARRRKLTGFIHLGVAAEIASLMGTLAAHHLWTRHQDPEKVPDLIRRYFLGVVQAFGRVRLSARDLAVFGDYYVENAEIEELAEERDLDLAVEVERRRVFLSHLSAGLQAQLAAAASPGGPLVERAALGPGDAPTALNPATGRGARPRTR